MGRPEGLSWWKIPIFRPGIDPTTFRPKPTALPRKIIIIIIIVAHFCRRKCVQIRVRKTVSVT